MVLHTQHQTALFLGAAQLFLNPLKMRFRITGLAPTILVITQRQQPNFSAKGITYELIPKWVRYSAMACRPPKS